MQYYQKAKRHGGGDSIGHKRCENEGMVCINVISVCTEE